MPIRAGCAARVSAPGVIIPGMGTGIILYAEIGAPALRRRRDRPATGHVRDVPGLAIPEVLGVVIPGCLKGVKTIGGWDVMARLRREALRR
jgi:hypothetical protein